MRDLLMLPVLAQVRLERSRSAANPFVSSIGYGRLSRKEMSNSRRTHRELDVISLPGSAFAPERADDTVHETRLSITSLKRSAKPAVRDHGLGCLRM